MSGFVRYEKKEVAEQTEAKKGRKPDLRIVQPFIGKDGKSGFKNVGAIWLSDKGEAKVDAILKIGDLRLLVFENKEKKE